MVTCQLLTDTEIFDGMIVDVITDLRRKRKRADCESIYKGIVKIADFSDISKEDLVNRINTPLIDEKILNKKNRNLDSYYFNENASPDNSNFSETPHDNILFKPPLTIQNQFSLLLRKHHQKLRRDQHQLILFLNLLSGLHLQTVKV